MRFSNGSSTPFCILCSLFSVLCSPGCLDSIPPDTLTGPRPGTVSGSVVSLCQGTPIQGADVTAKEVLEQGTGESRLTTTDAKGRFSFEGLQRGSWQLSVSKQKYRTASKSVVVTAGKPSPPEKIALSPESKTLPTDVKLDVLFVVDNSNSMYHEQQALAAAFPSFMDALLNYKFMLDLHVGVISTDMGAGIYNLPSCETAGGDKGKLQSTNVAGCTPPKDPYIQVQGSTTNVPGDMINDAFKCIAQLGLQGCGFEQHLGAVIAAVDPKLKINPKFLRSDSVLAVVVVSDEDDCSAVDTTLFDPSQQGLSDPLGPLTSFRCFEFGVTCQCPGKSKCDRTVAGPRTNCVPSQGKYLLGVDTFVKDLQAIHSKDKLFFAVIGGPTDKVEVGHDGANPSLKPSCQSPGGFAVPAIRLKAVVDKLSPASSFDSICQVNLKNPMANLAKKIVETALLNPCN